MAFQQSLQRKQECSASQDFFSLKIEFLDLIFGGSNLRQSNHFYEDCLDESETFWNASKTLNACKPLCCICGIRSPASSYFYSNVRDCVDVRTTFSTVVQEVIVLKLNSTLWRFQETDTFNFEMGWQRWRYKILSALRFSCFPLSGEKSTTIVFPTSLLSPLYPTLFRCHRLGWKSFILKTGATIVIRPWRIAILSFIMENACSGDYWKVLFRPRSHSLMHGVVDVY